ncbi:hypothetical protein PXK01_16715 [Phaeobacter sp. PT47_59]|uniref:DUF6950 family protein n=1 Tax=Phaeobacter sp. PT47_59 TaxID=3029979 RepID=UPI0023809EF0|nr:hypothetical protein [Phaeobacter sp. PT47_59]MDE4175807.1 hypothetical protein [Phaeobacter sp. PT47_59]
MTARVELLFAYLTEIRQSRRGFRPGTLDCALFAAGWVTRCTGQDLATDWAGAYRTLDEGKAKLKAQGLPDLAALAARHLQEIDGWEQAQPGDIAAIDEGGEIALGIVGGPQIHVMTLDGLDYVHLGRATRVFRP